MESPEILHPMEGTHAGPVCEVQPLGRISTGEVHGGLSCVGGTPRKGKECEESAPEEKEVAEAVHDELTIAPILLFTMQLVLGESRESGE